MGTLVHPIASMGCAHYHILMVGRLGDTLHLPDRQGLDAQCRHVHHIAIQAAYPQATILIGKQAVYVIRLQLAIGERKSLYGTAITMHLIHTIAIGPT